MIAGPVAPRTAASLQGSLSCHLERLEHGLSIVAQGVELLDVATIPFVARDVSGAPVLVFVADAQAHIPASVHAARAYAHLCANPWLLQRVFPHRLPGAVATCLRTLVVGMGLAPLELAMLRALALPDVVALDVQEWAVGGVREWCARPVLVQPARDDVGFGPPSATPAPHRELAREFLQWLERLDPDMTVDGDRFARRVSARGRALCTLAVGDKELTLALPHGAHLPLVERADAVAAMDLVMRAFQQVLRPQPGQPTNALPAGESPAAARAQPAAPAASALPSGLDDLREFCRTVAEVRVTRAERSALEIGEANA